MADTQEAVDRDLVVKEGEFIAVIVVSVLIFILLVIQIALLIYCFCRKRFVDKLHCCRDKEQSVEGDRVITGSKERLIREEIGHSEDEKPEVERQAPNVLLRKQELFGEEEKKRKIDEDKGANEDGNKDEDGDEQGDGDGDKEGDGDGDKEGDGDGDKEDDGDTNEGKGDEKDADADRDGDGDTNGVKDGDGDGEGGKDGDVEENGDLEIAARRLESLLTPQKENVVEPRIEESRDINPDERLLGREDPGVDPGTDNRSDDQQLVDEDERFKNQNVELPERPENFAVWSDPGEIRGRGNTIRRPITEDLTGTPTAPFRFHIHPIGVIAAWSDEDPKNNDKNGTMYTSPEEDQGFHEGSGKKDSNEEFEGSTDVSGEAVEEARDGPQFGTKAKGRDKHQGGNTRDAKSSRPDGSQLLDRGKSTGQHPKERNKNRGENKQPEGSELEDRGKGGRRRKRQNQDPLLDNSDSGGRGYVGSQLADEDKDRSPGKILLVGGGIGMPLGTSERREGDRQLDGLAKEPKGKSKGKGKKRRDAEEGGGGFEDEELQSEASTERDHAKGREEGKKNREGKRRYRNKPEAGNDVNGREDDREDDEGTRSSEAGDKNKGGKETRNKNKRKMKQNKGSQDDLEAPQTGDGKNDAIINGNEKLEGGKGTSPEKQANKGKQGTNILPGRTKQDGRKQRSPVEGEEQYAGDSGISDERGSEESRTNRRRPYGDDSDISSLDYGGLNYWPDDWGIFRGWETETTDDDLNVTNIEFTANNKLMKSGSLTGKSNSYGRSSGSPDRKGDKKRSRSRSKGRALTRNSLTEEPYDTSEDSLAESSALGRPPIVGGSLGQGRRSDHTHRRHDPRQKKLQKSLRLGRGLPDGAVLEDVGDDEEERDKEEIRKAYESLLPSKELSRMPEGKMNDTDRPRTRTGRQAKDDRISEGDNSSTELKSGRSLKDMDASGGHYLRGNKHGRMSKGDNSGYGNDEEGVTGHQHASSQRKKDRRSRSRGRREITERGDNSGRITHEENGRSVSLPSTSTSLGGPTGTVVAEEGRRSERLRRRERKKRRRSGRKEENKTSWDAYLEHDTNGDLKSPLAMIFMESDDDYR